MLQHDGTFENTEKLVCPHRRNRTSLLRVFVLRRSFLPGDARQTCFESMAFPRSRSLAKESKAEVSEELQRLRRANNFPKLAAPSKLGLTRREGDIETALEVGVWAHR